MKHIPSDAISLLKKDHETVKKLFAELAALNDTTPNDETYDFKVKVLQEDVEHHVKEEEGEMFIDAKKFLGAEKLQSLGEQIARRKEEVESN
jgi:Hemerythrin HHE cation binding domain